LRRVIGSDTILEQTAMIMAGPDDLSQGRFQPKSGPSMN
jgi:hypothetical protein